MKLSAKLTPQILTKLARGMTKGELDLTNDELLYSMVFVISTCIRRRSKYVDKLKARYGRAPVNTKAAIHFTKQLHNDVTVKNDREAKQLFWNLYKDMNRKLIVEEQGLVESLLINSLDEALKQSINESKEIAEQGA